jgi:glutamate N-acetyltransferase/amino-acid N-acetyltransferase
LTTDSGIKRASASVGDGSIVGVAKGAAMMAPNMATMLAFIVSDFSIEAGLAPTLGAAVEESFNRVSIDGCESTNDSVFLMTSVDRGTVERREFSAALASVCASLAEQIAADAEGAKRLVRIRVSGARDDASAASLGRAVAASALWRAAVFGADPNWGRVLSALGSHDRALDMAAVDLWIGSELVFAGGEPVGSLEAAAKFMDADGFTVACVVGAGPGSAEVLSADLSPDYVTLNAFGTT